MMAVVSKCHLRTGQTEGGREEGGEDGKGRMGVMVLKK